MTFQSIKQVEKAQTYLDIAIKRALKHEGTKKKGTPFEKAKPREHDRIGIIRDVLCTKLYEIGKGFPVFDELSDFYKELLRVTLDYDKLKKALASLNWAQKKISELAREHKKRIKQAKNFTDLDSAKKAYLGRISSVIKQISKNLEYLEHSRRVIKDYPVIKQLFTVCISGFPNVGKTTLLSKLTTSTPEIKEYAFTTKSLNLGYAKLKNEKVQFIDTPGTLNRPDKMNNIEKQAYLAVKYQADLIVYIFDLTEPYPLKDQKRLLKRIKQFKKPVILYLSKTDLLEQGATKDFSKKAFTSVDELKKEISKKVK
ncbi:hypothetical protein AYK26_00290 [Euryarchaeota archaeon SM23-78]|nr:MAG: hypothetical protein AYK26_00290 [Euryarchaeota archaeon SM23-78]MBW3000882.1 50S ribosome-binding GTPase [Candidatus Woesearchaeota archaeon]